jgi:hypothetical protein
MEFWLVVGLLLGVVLAWAAISDHRDRRYHHLRSHNEMADYHREPLRDVRAADMGFHLNPDRSWMHRPGSSQQPRRPAMDSTGDDVGPIASLRFWAMASRRPRSTDQNRR